jgi:hypothetical protein
MDETPDWFQLGVAARAAERPRTENPLLAPGKLPEITGQAFTAWRADVDQWWEGWEFEDRRRAGQPAVEPARRAR